MTPFSAEDRAEAAVWFARLRADDKSVSDEAGFHAWLAKDPQHAIVFEAMTEIWEMAGGAANPITFHQHFAR